MAGQLRVGRQTFDYTATTGRIVLRDEVYEDGRFTGFQAKAEISLTSYTLDGTPVNPARENALVAVNGVTAMLGTNIDRSDYVNQVWSLPIPTLVPRYYQGVLYLTSLLILSGQYQIQ